MEDDCAEVALLCRNCGVNVTYESTVAYPYIQFEWGVEFPRHLNGATFWVRWLVRGAHDSIKRGA
jgi:hypothetical protein